MTIITIDTVATLLATTPGRLRVANAPEGYDACLVAGAAQRHCGVTAYVARDDAHAASFAQHVKFFAPTLKLARLPAWDCLPYDRVGPASEISARRIATLLRLARRKADAPPLLVVTTASALLQKTLPRTRLLKASFVARPGKDIDIAALQAYFDANGYTRSSAVREKGDYAFRGGVIDLFAPGSAAPVRLDLFGGNGAIVRHRNPTLHQNAGRRGACPDQRSYSRCARDYPLSLELSGYIRSRQW
jgi:transcription-repair coupling factor (superfamily II helicase)